MLLPFEPSHAKHKQFVLVFFLVLAAVLTKHLPVSVGAGPYQLASDKKVWLRCVGVSLQPVVDNKLSVSLFSENRKMKET